MRGLWVDAFGEGARTPQEVDELVDFALDAGLDTLVVQVTRRGDSLANALPLPRADADLAALPFDPLAAVCDRAGEAGLAVHAWLAVTPIAQAGAPDPRYTPWLSRRVDGQARDRHGIAHLDLGHPEARAFVSSCAATVARSYPVAGVNLDRVRYPDSAPPGSADWGYNPVALARYAEETGAERAPAPSDPGWQAWRRRQVTALVDETTASVRAVRDDVVVSASGVCLGGLDAGWRASRPWVECGQDWPGWLREGRLDRVLAMNYRGDADDADLVPSPPDGLDLRTEGAAAAAAEPTLLRARFDDWTRLALRAGGARAVVGVGLYLRDVAASAADVRRAVELRVDGERAGGWCGYSYRTPSREVLLGRRAAADERAALAEELRTVTG